MTQAAMADALDISPSYLNLIERWQRPLSATVMVRLAERFDLDVASLGGEEVPGGSAGLRRRTADPLFADVGTAPHAVDQRIQASPHTSPPHANCSGACVGQNC